MNPASLRTRTLLAIMVMLTVLVGILLVLAESIIGRSFRAAEERTVHDRVQQALNALNNDIAGLDRVTRDYALWDDSYAFVREPDPTYIADNMADVTFINNSLSYFAFVNTAGELVYARAFDLATEQELPIPAELRRFDGPNAPLLQHGDPAGHLAGLVVLADGPLLIAARPILTSQGEGPPAGTLLMGRVLDAREVAQLATITRLSLTVAGLDDPGLAPELQRAAAALAAGQPIATTVLDSQWISGATHVPDLRGGPGVLLQVELPREIYQLGQGATREYALVLLGAGLLFGAIAFWALERTVLARTIALSVQVAAVKASRPDTQVTITGSDEIGQLGSAINQMLSGLARAQQQIAESEMRYRQLIELSPDAIIVHDGQHISYTNSAGARLLGSDSPAACIGQPIDTTIGAITPGSDGTPVLSELMLAQPDGMMIEAELVVLPFHDRDTPAVQAIVRNITERKQVEKALRAAKEAADTANRAKSQFLATMSHELRTPLTAIIGYAELLDRALTASASDEVLRDLGRIRAAGTHLLAIINDVLDLSKIEAGRMHVQCTTVAVASVLQIVADTVRPLAERNGNRLELRGIDVAGVMVTAEVHLRQILINLVGNACKFTHEGEVTLTVTALPSDAEAGADQVMFAVRDTGIGMRPEQLELLFRDFIQIDSSPTRKYGGTGLGLALSRRLARLLGGDITVVSEQGVGSTFTLILPRELVLETSLGPADADNAPSRAPAPPAAAPAPDATSETQLVLVIDDDPAVRDLLPRALAHRGLYFETAASGAEGLELATALLPDLIILDVLLPELDGWTVLRRLKEDPETLDIPVLMLTIDQDAERGLVLGAAGILHKPADTDQLAHRMASLMSRGTGLMHVLLVEDDSELRGYLRRTLERDGWTVDEAADGQTALALLEQRHPALAVIDLMLPGMDGITLIAAIRACPGGDTLPILVVTAKDLTLDEQEQLNRSVEQVLRKGSFRGDDLLRSTRALVGVQGLPVLQREGRNGTHSLG